MKLTKTLLLLFLITGILFAQDDKDKKPEYGWKNEAIGILNFSQTSFDNWTRGGENSWLVQLDVNGKFAKDMEGYNWTSSGKIAYGMTQIGSDDAKKAADDIKLETVYTYKLGGKLNPYASLTFQSQFMEGYLYKDDGKIAVSKFMDPGFFTESVGLNYTPGETFNSRLGPAAKQTITDKYFGYADDPATAEIEKTKMEIGAESKTELNWKMTENIVLVSKLLLFSNLKALNEVDVDWDTLISAKVHEYIVVSFNFNLFYDRDFDVQRQLKQVLAVGLSYSFY